MSSFELLIYEKEGCLACVTINRPAAMNALSNALVEEFDKVFDLIEEDKEIRALIITGAGEKAFMAGADIKELEARTFILGREQTKRRHQNSRLLDRLLREVPGITPQKLDDRCTRNGQYAYIFHVDKKKFAGLAWRDRRIEEHFKKQP